MKKNVIIFGENGMLGMYMKTFFKDRDFTLYTFDRKKYNIQNVSKENLFDLLSSITKNTKDENYIINCAGVIPQSVMKNTSDKLYLTVNTIFPILLQEVAKELDFQLIHISTDCVFDGKENGMYIESNEHLEQHIYGVSKSLGEYCNSLIIRTSIIGEEVYHKRNLMEFFKKNKSKTIVGFENHMWNGITCFQLVKIVHEIISKQIIWKGVRHFFSPKVYSKYEIAKIVNNIYDLEMTIEKGKHDQDINRTLSTEYETNALFNIPDLEIQIQQQKDFYDIRNPIIHIPNETVLNREPFPHVVIDNFLDPIFAATLQDEILTYPDSKWDRYDNPFEQKFTFNKKNEFGENVQKLFDLFESNEFIKELSCLFQKTLYKDEYKHYWGIHKYNDKDYLDIHVDAGIHPKSKQKKQVTLGLYLSKNWKEENNGHLQLWKGTNACKNNARIISCEKSILPIFNRLVLFECNDFSWHGNPVAVSCKSDEKRIFVTMSYMSEEKSDLNKRQRAFFVPRPTDKYNKKKEELRFLRSDPKKYAQVYRTNSQK